MKSTLPPDTADPVLRSGDTVERVANHLKEQILEGSLVPGQRLVSRDLMEHLGVSRGSLREAFRRLAGERLVELIPNRGAIVRRLSAAEVVSLFQIREALEGQAARLAADHINEADNRRVFQAIVKEGEALRRSMNMQAFMIHNRAFHQAIVKISGNTELALLIDRYQLAVFMAQLKQAIGAEAIILNSIDQHMAIAQAILAGDANGAYDAMKKHLWHSANSMLQRKEAATDRHFLRQPVTRKHVGQ
ncbi:GntR family transcriptional regulator [Alcaligenaceae bacterium]|nr:GntR family transcriptional regulator [Alcaligenaceae bacterium]